MSLENIVVNVTYIVYVLAPLVKRELALRLVLMATSFGFGYWAYLEDLPWTIFWNVIFVVMSMWRIVKLLRERRAVELTLTQEQVHQTLFSDMTRRQFSLFWLMGEDLPLADGERIVAEGIAPEYLYVLTGGRAMVHLQDKDSVVLEAITTIGEMSFVGGELTPATASVDLIDGTVRAWPQATLRTLEDSHPELLAPFLSGIGRGLSAKVAR